MHDGYSNAHETQNPCLCAMLENNVRNILQLKHVIYN